MDRVYDAYLKKRRKDPREQGGVEEIQALDVTIGQIADQVALRYKVASESLYRKRSIHAEARSVLIELCRVHISKKMSISSIGDQLGGISISAVGQNTKRLSGKMAHDFGLQKRYSAIEKALHSL